MIKVLTVLLISTISISSYCQDLCNSNWLSTPVQNSFVTIGDLDVPGNQITVEAAINRTTPYTPGVGDNSDGDIVSKHLGPESINYLLRPNHAYITTNTGVYATPDFCEIELNRTYHVAFVYDGISLKFYRNGFLMSQVAATGNLVQNDILTRIGRYTGVTQENFIGYINEVRIWNVARSQAEIRNFMGTTLPNPTTQTGLLAYYRFDDLANKQGNTTFNGILGGSAALNSANTSCVLVVDSCLACTNWLGTPSQPAFVNIGDLDITGSSLTVEAKFNRTSNFSNGTLTEADLVSKHTGPNDANYLLRPVKAIITTTNGFFSTPDVCPLDLNRTYHVAMVYNGSSLKFYRDGYLMSEVAATGNLFQNNLPTYIGFLSTQALNENFIGYINEVKIWNVARSQQQLKDYMDMPLPDPITQVGLQAYYTFDNLQNKQGNTQWNGTLGGNALINRLNPNCTFLIDSCNIVIPVTLTSFSTSVKDDKILQLTWATAEESGIDKYVIQRSTGDRHAFRDIATVPANNHSLTNSYVYLDRSVESNQIYYYRLAIVEHGVVKKYSEIKTGIVNNKNFDFAILENLIRDEININITALKQPVEICMINNTGQKLMTKLVSTSRTVKIDCRNFSTGMYWLVFSSQEGIFTRKIFKY